VSAAARDEGGGETRRVARAAAISGIATVVAALAGVGRVKLYAVFLGAAGVGVISQVQNLQNTLNVLAMLGVGLGVSRDIARARGRGDGVAVRRVYSTARVLVLGASLAGVAAVALFSRRLSILLFGDPGYAWLLLWTAPTLLFATLSRALTQVLGGFAEYGVTARYTLASSGLSVAFLVLLLPALGLPGAGLALPLTALASWVVVELLFRRQHPELRAAGFGYHPSVGRALLAVGAASLIIGTADQLALLAIRTRLIQAQGLEANGWFQGVWGLSQHVLTAAISFQGAYSFARVSELRDPVARSAETDRTLRMTLLLVTPMAAGMILLREPMVRVFLSPEFEPSLPLFAPQAAGTLLRAVGLAIGIGALAVAPLKAWLWIGLGTSGCFVLSYWLLAGGQGLMAAPTAYAISGAFHVLASWYVMRRYGGLRLDRSMVRFTGISLLLVVATFVVADRSLLSYAWGGLLLAGWGLLGITRDEGRKLLRVLAGRFGRRP
jgi:O-antigen/teichoic acid export membrane protein